MPSKKIRYLISSLVLSGGFVVIQLLDAKYKFPGIFLLVILTLFFSIWNLYEGLGKNMTWISVILPTLFTFSVGIFWFLLPVSLFVQTPLIFFYATGIYILMSTMNIYIVSSSVRTINLVRAARGVGFVLTLVTAFLLFDNIFSIRQNVFINIALAFVASFLLFIQGFWSVNLNKLFDREVFKLSLISSLVMAEITGLIFFWPVTVVVGSLFLTSGVYLLLGLGQAKLEERLFPSTSREYLTLGLIVLLGMFFATRWGG